jgi:hypothetical protein
MKEFPDTLAHIPRNRITFNLLAMINGVKKPVRVSESAWSSCISRLAPGEVVDIEVVEEKNSPYPKSSKSQPSRCIAKKPKLRLANFWFGFAARLSQPMKAKAAPALTLSGKDRHIKESA